jgi:ABC-type dipeptide/oligopeptide/nickel transport system ATPase subunit
VDTALLDRVALVRKTIEYGITQRTTLRKKHVEIANSIRDAELLLENKKLAHKLLDLFVKGTEYRIREYIEPLITEGLHFVFEQNLYFHLYFSSRRNQLEIDFIILRNTSQEEQYQKFLNDDVKYHKKMEMLIKTYSGINDDFGGAINQVLGVLLKVIIVELLQVKGPMLFDEPTSMVSEEYAGRLGKLLSSLSRKYNRQYCIITHSNALAMCGDIKYNISLLDKVSKVVEINE